MKKLFCIIFLGMFFLFLSSCEKSIPPLEIQKQMKLSDEFVFPKGTKLFVNEKNEFSEFKLPSGYFLVGLDKEGILLRSAMGKIKCTCTQGSGCNPFVASGPSGEVSGCSATGCTKCTMEISAIPKSDVLEVLASYKIIKEEDAIHFITEMKDFNDLKNPTDSILKSEWLVKEIDKYISAFQIQNKEKIRNLENIDELGKYGYVLIPTAVYGYKFYFPVEEKLVLSANPLINEVMAKFYKYKNKSLEEGKYRCSCYSGTGCVLKKQSMIIGSAVWCEAGSCLSCTLER